MARLFVAVRPPARVPHHLRPIPRDGGEARGCVPQENWHVTLECLGEADAAHVASQLDRVSLPAVTAEVTTRLETLGRGSVVAPVGGVDALARAVHDGVSPDVERSTFRGHLTL